MAVNSTWYGLNRQVKSDSPPSSAGTLWGTVLPRSGLEDVLLETGTGSPTSRQANEDSA
jgi:hypothetical protein